MGKKKKPSRFISRVGSKRHADVLATLKAIFPGYRIETERPYSDILVRLGVKDPSLLARSRRLFSDIWIVDLDVIIEVDGAWHEGPVQFEKTHAGAERAHLAYEMLKDRDRAKDLICKLAGLSMVRIGDEDGITSDDLLLSILGACAAQHPRKEGVDAPDG